jgi:ribosomal protein S18 acetylase RimI-like enzyme
MSEAAKSFSPSGALRFRTADPGDVDALVCLINSAFRVEQPFIEGDRIDAKGVRSYMEKGKFLVADDSAGLAGCVYVELRGDRGYLGLLGVDPQRQGTGLGRKLMEHAENFFRQAACVAVDLRVISARAPLPSFYRHIGYFETGTAPFAPDVPVKVTCHYILMSKDLL